MRGWFPLLWSRVSSLGVVVSVYYIGCPIWGAITFGVSSVLLLQVRKSRVYSRGAKCHGV